jgi:CRP-like cAMP-binding protein
MSAEKDPFARFLKPFEKGAVLFEEGDEGEELYIIRSGKVAIKKRVPHGQVTLAVLEKGDFFGEMAMLEHIVRTASAEMEESGKLIVIDSEVFGDMIKANPEIAVRMLRKYSLRLRETTKQIEELAAKAEANISVGVVPEAEASPVSTVQPVTSEEPVVAPQQTEAVAYFISKASGNVFPVFKNDALIGRYDSVTGSTPEVDLTQEDASRNISRRHARLVTKEGKHFVAEEIGTMNGTFLNGEKLPTGVLTPIKDGDEVTLCRLSITFRVPGPRESPESPSP